MNILIVFTYDYSLKLWNNSGILERELIYYKKLLNYDNNLKITFVTYGDQSDFDYQPSLQNLSILPVYSIVKKSNAKLINYIKLIPRYFVSSWLVQLIVKYFDEIKNLHHNYF